MKRTWRKSRSSILVLVLVFLAPAITASKEHAAESNTPANEQRIQRVIEHEGEVIEQLQLPDKPQITVNINYKKGAATPMPATANCIRDRS